MIFRLAIAPVVAMWYAGSALAADFSIGYVDLRAMIMESNSGKQHKANLEKLAKEKQAAVEGEQKKFEALKTKFDKDALTLTDSQKKERQKELQEKLQAFQKMAGEAQQELVKQDQAFTRAALSDARAAVAEVAKAENMRMVVEKGEANVLYGDPALDVTKKALEKFNARTAKK
jgi:outer membrane protein